MSPAVDVDRNLRSVLYRNYIDGIHNQRRFTIVLLRVHHDATFIAASFFCATGIAIFYAWFANGMFTVRQAGIAETSLCGKDMCLLQFLLWRHVYFHPAVDDVVLRIHL